MGYRSWGRKVSGMTERLTLLLPTGSLTSPWWAGWPQEGLLLASIFSNKWPWLRARPCPRFKGWLLP